MSNVIPKGLIYWSVMRRQMNKEKIYSILSPILLASAVLAETAFFAYLCTLDIGNNLSVVFFIGLYLISTIVIMKIYDRFG